MNRRSFISGCAALVGGVALEQAIPLGRVWSFPSQILITRVHPFDFSDHYIRAVQEMERLTGIPSVPLPIRYVSARAIVARYPGAL